MSKFLKVSLAAVACAAVLSADSENSESNAESPIFLSGEAEIFHKEAMRLNQAPLPNNSYGYVGAQLNAGFRHDNFEAQVGGVFAGITKDSERNSESGAQAWNYVGYFGGYRSQFDATPDNTHNAFVHNAYAKFENDNFNVQAGRFYHESDWIDMYAEGALAQVNFGGAHIKLMHSTTMALYGWGWVMDYSNMYAKNGISNVEIGYENELFALSAFVYTSAKEFTAPGFNAELYLGETETFGSKTKITAIFPKHHLKMLDYDLFYFGNFYDEADEHLKQATTLFVRQDFIFSEKYSVAAGYYKNFGNANARMGTFGNPIGVDVWDNSVLSVAGPALNAAVAPDSESFLIYTKASFENLGKFANSFDVGFDMRFTSAPSADEQSLKLYFDWGLSENLTLSVIANYYTHKMKKDVWASDTIENFESGTKLDRSYIMSRVAFGF